MTFWSRITGAAREAVREAAPQASRSFDQIAVSAPDRVPTGFAAQDIQLLAVRRQMEWSRHVTSLTKGLQKDTATALTLARSPDDLALAQARAQKVWMGQLELAFSQEQLELATSFQNTAQRASVAGVAALAKHVPETPPAAVAAMQAKFRSQVGSAREALEKLLVESGQVAAPAAPPPPARSHVDGVRHQLDNLSGKSTRSGFVEEQLAGQRTGRSHADGVRSSMGKHDGEPTRADIARQQTDGPVGQTREDIARRQTDGPAGRTREDIARQQAGGPVGSTREDVARQDLDVQTGRPTYEAPTGPSRRDNVVDQVSEDDIAAEETRRRKAALADAEANSVGRSKGSYSRKASDIDPQVLRDRVRAHMAGHVDPNAPTAMTPDELRAAQIAAVSADPTLRNPIVAGPGSRYGASAGGGGVAPASVGQTVDPYAWGQRVKPGAASADKPIEVTTVSTEVNGFEL